MKPVRTRIAPSPTGFPHIGTMYQALFNYAYAKKQGGSFIVRFEDTDRARFVAGAEEKIYEALDWLGLSEDESSRKAGPYGPYRQSERLSLYAKYAQELVDKGYAYYCTYTPEQLGALREQRRKAKLPPVINDVLRTQNHARHTLTEGSYVIRMRMPENERIVVHDQIRGDIVFDSNLIDDQVIIKSDGFPTYHLAVVVDDHLMEITHVLRGEEWINSTPKHSLLYRYFGWQEPLWFHTSLLRNPDKSKMSKRQSHTNIDWYKAAGYLPEALCNYLALMAWSHPEQKEVFDRAEFLRVFDFADLKAVGPAFDLKKMDWINGEYIRAMDQYTLAQRLSEYVRTTDESAFAHISHNPHLFTQSIPLVQERIKTFADYWPLSQFYYTRPSHYEIAVTEYANDIAQTLIALESVSDWTSESIADALAKAAEHSPHKRGDYFMSIRVAITGKKITPPLNESMQLLGKQECIERLKAVA